MLNEPAKIEIIFLIQSAKRFNEDLAKFLKIRSDVPPARIGEFLIELENVELNIKSIIQSLIQDDIF